MALRSNVLPGVAALVLASGPVLAGDLRVIDAVKHRDARQLQAVIKEGADVNASEGDGATALHWAAHLGDRALVEALIKLRARVNAVNDFGVTPLALACETGQTDIVRALLNAGANPNLAQSTGEAPIMTCAFAGAAGAVQALLAHKASVDAAETFSGQTALMWAAAQGHTDVVRILIEAGANVHQRSQVTRMLVNTGGRSGPTRQADFGGFTPILFAARGGHLESARLLLKAGADENDTAGDATSALVIAAHSGHRELAAFLLEQGANPNDAGGGYTPLHAAVLRGDAELVTTLLRHGADPNAVVTRATPIPRYSQNFVLTNQVVGATPFFLAAKFAEAGLMRLLTSSGADPVRGLKNGTTPLMAAAGSQWLPQEDRRERQLPIDVLIAARKDETPSLEAVRVMLDLGAEVNAADATGQTALHAAASQGLASVVRLLASRGGALDAKTKRGVTPMAAAAAAQEAAVADLLRNLGARE